jgi:hypothetical protein
VSISGLPCYECDLPSCSPPSSAAHSHLQEGRSFPASRLESLHNSCFSQIRFSNAAQSTTIAVLALPRSSRGRTERYLRYIPTRSYRTSKTPAHDAAPTHPHIPVDLRLAIDSLLAYVHRLRKPNHCLPSASESLQLDIVRTNISDRTAPTLITSGLVQVLMDL